MFRPFLLIALWAFFGDSADNSNPLADLLDLVNKTSPDSYAAAQSQYNALRQAGPADVRVPYAMALVALARHHPADAANYLEGVPNDGDFGPPIRRLRILIYLVRSQHAAAQRDARELAAIVGRLQPDEAGEIARWLGSMVGFYAGPGASRIKPAELSALETELIVNLPASLAATYQAGKTSTTNKFQALKQQQVAARTEARAKLIEKRQREQEQNEKALIEATKKREDAQKAVDDQQQQIDKYIADNQKDAGKLAKDMEKQADKRRNLQSQIASSAQRRANGNESSHTNYLEGKRADANQKLVQANQQLQQMGNTLQDQQTKLEGLKKSVAKLQAMERGLLTKQEELKKPVSDTPPTPIDAQLDSAETYVGIDLDRERRLILANPK